MPKKGGRTVLTANEAAVKIQSVIRMFQADCRVRTRRMEVRRATRHQRALTLDPYSHRCLLLLQRAGRGALSRVRVHRKAARAISSFVRKRSVASSMASAKKQKWIPLGYNPPRTEADRLARLRAVKQQTRVKSAMLLQTWWREQLKRNRVLDHTLRVSGLVLLNMKAIMIQRWWRCALRQKKFVIPMEVDVHNAAQSIVAAEELRMHRSVQAAPLKKLWHDVVKSERRNQQKPCSLETQAASRNAKNLQQSFAVSDAWDPGDVVGAGSFMFDDNVSMKMLALQNIPQGEGAGMQRRKHAKVVPVPRYLPSLKTSRYKTGHQVAIAIRKPEWNGSASVGVPQWYARPHIMQPTGEGAPSS